MQVGARGCNWLLLGTSFRGRCVCTALADKGLRLPCALEEGLIVHKPTQLASQVA